MTWENKKNGMNNLKIMDNGKELQPYCGVDQITVCCWGSRWFASFICRLYSGRCENCLLLRATAVVPGSVSQGLGKETPLWPRAAEQMCNRCMPQICRCFPWPHLIGVHGTQKGRHELTVPPGAGVAGMTGTERNLEVLETSGWRMRGAEWLMPHAAQDA